MNHRYKLVSKGLNKAESHAIRYFTGFLKREKVSKTGRVSVVPLRNSKILFNSFLEHCDSVDKGKNTTLLCSFGKGCTSVLIHLDSIILFKTFGKCVLYNVKL